MSVPVSAAVRPVSPRAVPEPRSGVLRPAEVANAGVFGALAVIIVSVGTFLPHLGVIELLSAVPFAIVGLRYRVRAVVAATVAAGFVAFLAAGESKADAVSAAFGPDARPDPAVPSSLVAAEADLVSVLLDRAAAVGLGSGARA